VIRGDVLGDGEHGENVTPESTLDVVKLSRQLKSSMNGKETYIDLGDGLLHDLLGSIVDQDIQSSVLPNVLRNELLAVLGVHNVECECHAFLTVLFDCLLDSLGTFY